MPLRRRPPTPFPVPLSTGLVALHRLRRRRRRRALTPLPLPRTLPPLPPPLRLLHRRDPQYPNTASAVESVLWEVQVVHPRTLAKSSIHTTPNASNFSSALRWCVRAWRKPETQVTFCSRYVLHVGYLMTLTKSYLRVRVRGSLTRKLQYK